MCEAAGTYPTNHAAPAPPVRVSRPSCRGAHGARGVGARVVRREGQEVSQGSEPASELQKELAVFSLTTGQSVYAGYHGAEQRPAAQSVTVEL